MEKLKIGLALGSGGARGWCHIGVIRALEEMGIKPDVVTGTSMGALVGAAYISGNLDELEEWALSINTAKLALLLDVNINSGGLVEGKNVVKFFEKLDMKPLIEDYDIPYAAIATDMGSGREVWFQKGPIIDAMRASISLPGIISPVYNKGRWLLDGGMTNPLPVSTCRALGADIIIAVNPEAKEFDRMWKPPERKVNETWNAIVSGLPDAARNMLESVTGNKKKEAKPPNYFDVVASSIDLMVHQVRRNRLVSDPPHVLLDVDLDTFTIMDFNRAKEAIDHGRKTVEDAKEEILSIKAG